VVEKHEAIIDAIRSVEEQSAEEAARAHMRNAWDVRLSRMLGSHTDAR
jgi:DNA-binding GntR family transcriptional regulator